MCEQTAGSHGNGCNTCEKKHDVDEEEKKRGRRDQTCVNEAERKCGVGSGRRGVDWGLVGNMCNTGW